MEKEGNIDGKIDGKRGKDRQKIDGIRGKDRWKDKWKEMEL